MHVCLLDIDGTLISSGGAGKAALEAEPFRTETVLGVTRREDNSWDYLLDRKDRMSMAVGLEVRVPFCDHRLVEYAWNVPWELKCLGGEPKGLLRAALADRLPPVLLRRPKSMFPVAVDPAYDDVLDARVRDLLGTGSAVGPLLDAGRVTGFLAGAVPVPPWMRRLALAFLVQVDAWLREYRVRVTATG